MVPEDPRGRGFKDSSEKLKDYKELNDWQKQCELSSRKYTITAKFPNEERFGLTLQVNERLCLFLLIFQHDRVKRQHLNP